jgi:hypothetical protein
MRDAPLVRTSPFSSYGRRAYYNHVSHFIEKGEALLVVHLSLIRKRDAIHMDASPFILPHPAQYRSLVTAHLQEPILTNF